MYLADQKGEEGEKLVDPLIAVGKLAATAMTVMPFGARVQTLLDPEFPNGNRYYTKGQLLPLEQRGHRPDWGSRDTQARGESHGLTFICIQLDWR